MEPDARSVGVGEAMADLVVAWFEEEGCAGALPWPYRSRATKNFFEESGFTARLLVMHGDPKAMADRPEVCVGAIAWPTTSS